MLHIKYEGSRPSAFRQDDFLCFQIVSQCLLCDLHDEAILTTESQFEQFFYRIPLGDVTYEISKRKAFCFLATIFNVVSKKSIGRTNILQIISRLVWAEPHPTCKIGL